MAYVSEATQYARSNRLPLYLTHLRTQAGCSDHEAARCILYGHVDSARMMARIAAHDALEFIAERDTLRA